MRFARFAGRIAHDRGLHHEDIDELLQELRVRFWRARKEGLLDLSANYVRRAAISAALDIIRRRRVDRNVSLDDNEAGAHPLAAVSAGPAEQLEQSELARRVALAVDGLAPSRRDRRAAEVVGRQDTQLAVSRFGRSASGTARARDRNSGERAMNDDELRREYQRSTNTMPLGPHPEPEQLAS